MKGFRTIVIGSAGLLALGGSILGLTVTSAASASSPVSATQSAVDSGANVNVQSGAQDTTGVDTAGAVSETTTSTESAVEAVAAESAVSDGVGGHQDATGSLGIQVGTQQ